ncbi:alpha/beta hydrolase [Trueperella pyogenes]|uniref:alpha/beta hydrolase n=1 Tax=Trueperella pyogenes TaxID=1661 RepID=UPI003252C9D9
MTWTPDFLGEGFYQQVLPLYDDDYGPNRAVLVTYLPTAPASFAVLAIHGWNDYFYHYEFAESISQMGGHFYALDLRKYGRSHMDGQMWGYVEDLSDYDEEIHAALDIITTEHGEDMPIFLYGHSTGGLTATLWADRHPGAIAGLILNSPWLEFQGYTAVRMAGQPVLETINKLAPTTIIPQPDDGYYQRLLTGFMSEEERAQLSEQDAADPFLREGGWNPDPRFRHMPTFPIRAGWLRAVTNGHERVAQGLDIRCPILVLTSAKTHYSDIWDDRMRHADTVLNVDQLWKRVPWLGDVVTLVKVPDAIHDVLLSRKSARDYSYKHIRTFVRSVLD